MARPWRAALVLLAFLIVSVQGQAGAGSAPVEDVVEVCSERFVADDSHLRSVCEFGHGGYGGGEIKGEIADDSLSTALAFPHRLDDVDSMAHLPALSPALCESGAEGLRGEAITEFLLRLAKRKPSQQPKVLKLSYLRVNGPFNAPPGDYYSQTSV